MALCEETLRVRTHLCVEKHVVGETLHVERRFTWRDASREEPFRMYSSSWKDANRL